jgi:hypothetical protein
MRRGKMKSNFLLLRRNARQGLLAQIALNESDLWRDLCEVPDLSARKIVGNDHLDIGTDK